MATIDNILKGCIEIKFTVGGRAKKKNPSSKAIVDIRRGEGFEGLQSTAC